MRETLINELADGWRNAENVYIDSGYQDDDAKSEMWDKQKAAILTPEETAELEQICADMGI